MGNKLSVKRRRNSSSVKDEKIMADIYALTNNTSNTTSSTRRNTYDSQQSYDLDINFKYHKEKTPSASAVDADISEKLISEELAQKFTVNLLLSGTEQSGKYIIFKQLEQAFKGSIDKQQTKLALDGIRVQIVKDMVVLCNLNISLNHQQQIAKYKIKTSELQEICIRIASLKGISYTLSKELAMLLYLLWNDAAIQETYKNALELRILKSNTKYFMDKLFDIVDTNYILTFDDFIEIRDSQSKGVSQKQFLIETKQGGYKFNVSQINKQRSERRRWSPYLDNIQIFVYVINLSQYDVPNNLQNAIDLFEKICADPTFTATDFVILLNGINAFENKIQSIPFTVFDVVEPNQSECTQQYLVNKLKTICRNSNVNKHVTDKKRRSIYFHRIDDSNIEQIGLLLQKIHTDIITTSMKRMGYVL